VDGVVTRALRAFALGAVAPALLTACGDPAADHRGGRPPTFVEAMRVEPQPFRDVVELVGQLEADESVVIKPEIAGIVESIDFQEGETVPAGKVLFRLQSARQRASLREAQARRLLAADVFRRTSELAKKQISATAELDRARAELEAADAAVEITQVELDRTEIRAPFDGSVGARQVSPGDRVDGDTSLVQIDKIDRLQLLFAVPETAVRLVRNGIDVSLSVAPFPGERFPGKVFFVAPSLDPETRRLMLKAGVPNAEGRLRPGMFATIEAEVERIDAALVVPESAIVYDSAGAFVWRIGEGDVPVRVPVELGPRREGSVVVRKGLAPGDRVVSAGTHKVVPGAPVVIRASDGETPAGEPAAAPAGAGKDT
jgi:membrane fusion protein (multidrug efflux system)